MTFTMRHVRLFVGALLAVPLGLGFPKAYSWVQESGALASRSTMARSEHGDHGAGASKPHAEGGHEARHKIIATHPVVKDVTNVRPFVCQIHACKHIEVRALSSGYLEEIPVKEGQSVKGGELMFKILPTLYKAKLDYEAAEAQSVQIEYNNTQRLVHDNVVSAQELALAGAKKARADAKVKLATAELNFTEVKAPFDGIIDRLHQQKGSLVSEGDILTTLSDNSVMWVYFNVPESRYLEYKSDPQRDNLQVNLFLANAQQFNQPGHIGAIEADFNNETGNIAFRADFPNPDRLLRHGQTGTIVLSRRQPNALVIPQRATFEILAKKYVYVIDDAHVVHQREIEIKDEMDDIYVLKGGLDVNDCIVFEGIQQVRDGETIEYEHLAAEEILGHLKFRAE